ncbi:MAG: two-component system response regulator [Candidatus Omnitrophica bacterium CG11_big_fil_rev_8_21_14_0_20_42_13]|uniref:Two-component system response regulator n=1 Tax=Candidatus Ghiorseimicrobium undicola TaxID=1974746 RepID=A0A2H0M085_9BACT|nr:MAG: two-component system response regulator [Candidatus Omnitrophica bacterium CG11_big_fil_rev_8_21_14_0_20_42_13]
MYKKKILIIEDEAGLVETVKFRLEANNYEVITADNGEEGLDKARREKPSLVLLDLMIPRIDGHEVCRLLKSDEKYKDIPIIIFTARAGEDDEKLASEAGANDYITKPFESKELLFRIEGLLKN